ncbi:hypothetical protein ACJJIF_12255 [Microbulbifer sp. SSSA002]|uniref:hypothetical protein n=1 Tax=Microbulbifer sp. SSSA002 TaxID=3243376 RepID=UPI00403935C0
MKNTVKFWVVDATSNILLRSSIKFDDYDGLYYSRSIVPANSPEEAIKELTSVLKEDHIEVVEILSAVDFNSKSWNSKHDEYFSTTELHKKSRISNTIIFGLFTPKEPLEEEQ